jgi:hypothetical protein
MKWLEISRELFGTILSEEKFYMDMNSVLSSMELLTKIEELQRKYRIFR